MYGTERAEKEVASSSRKRVKTGATIPPAPAVPRGQTQHYGAKTVTSEGKNWYKTHTEAKYFSNVDPMECNVSMVREFYDNWKPDVRSHFVTAHGVELSDIERRYPLNEHAKAMLGLVPEFLEPVWDDVPTNVDKRRTMSDSESDFDEEGEPLAIEGTAVDDGIDE
uniref:Uncharacterized protein n=1 Tax=Solanum tuberosum TaxID=4113 RepID=M1DFJ3_SOLTU